MLRPGQIVIGFLSGILLSSDARAATPTPQENPYQGIVDRNVFGLRPPTPPPVVEPPPAPLGKVTLTGIFTIFGTKQTTMKVSFPPKPGQPPAKEESYMLTEGERMGDIEIVEIDEKAGTVKIKNRGIEDTLDFLKNGAKPSAMPAPSPMPQLGQVSPFTLPTTMPSGLPSGASITTIGGPANTKSIPTTRTMRPVTTPGGALMNPQATTTAGKTPATPQLTPEEQIILMEIERERTKDAVKAGKLPPLPPTVLTPPPAPQ